MKKIIVLIVLAVVSIGSYAQTFTTKTPGKSGSATRGNFGTYQSFGQIPGTICAVTSNTVTPVASGKLDTLTNVDTGYVQFTVPNNLDFTFDFTVTKISGTVAGTALLQGSLDNSTWFTITGNTTYCASCQGASATVTNTTGTKHYQWYVPHSATNYPFYQVQVISSGTMTASYNGTLNTKY
jgi:hypothetical protein